jgi:hypothetical protein
MMRAIYLILMGTVMDKRIDLDVSLMFKTLQEMKNLSEALIMDKTPTSLKY